MKLEPDYKSDDSILDEYSDDDSVELTDSKTQLYGKKKSERNSSEETEEKPKHESKQEKR